MYKSLIVAGAAALACVASAQTPLYGISSNFFNGSTPGYVFLINSTTGAATQVAAITGAGGVSTSIVGASELNGTLYVSDAFANGGDFGSVNAVTGAFTVIGNQNGSANWWTLAPNPTADVLYTIESDGGEPYNGSLLSVNPATGVPTVIGQPVDANGNVVNVGDLAYNSNTNTLYGLDNGNNLYTIDPTTGLSTLVGSTGLAGGNVSDMTYDPTTNALYYSDGQNLYSVNMTTGLGSFIGSNGTSYTIDGLAAPTPEPSSLAVFGMGLGLACFLRRKRRS